MISRRRSLASCPDGIVYVPSSSRVLQQRGSHKRFPIQNPDAILPTAWQTQIESGEGIRGSKWEISHAINRINRGHGYLNFRYLLLKAKRMAAVIVEFIAVC